MKLNENIKSLREEMGMTQSELANSLFVTPQSVSRWENGSAYPDIEKLPLLSEIFGVTVDELLGVSQPSAYDISKKLIKAREKAHAGIPADRLEYLGLLEKGFDLGTSRFLPELMSAARKLNNDGLLTEERFSEIIKKIKTRLSEVPLPSRNRFLSTIIINENEEYLSEWQNFITDDNNMACWHDLVLHRYLFNCKEPEWTKQRAEVLYQDISKMVYLMTQKSSPSAKDMLHKVYEPIQNCNSAIALINIFSNRDDDIFISLRINVECRLAATYIYNKEFESFYKSLNRLMELICICESLVGKTVSGSTDWFKDYAHIIDAERFLNDFTEVQVMLSTSPCYDYKDDPKIKEFTEFIEKEHGAIDPFCCIPYRERKEFEVLLKLAQAEVDKFIIKPKELTYVFAVKTSKGKIYKYKVSDNKSIEKFISMLKADSDTQVSYMTGFLVDELNDGCLELPSHRFREKLCDLDKRNLETKNLLNGMFYYIFKTFRQTISPNTLLKYE